MLFSHSAAFCALIAGVSAHSWLEQLQVVVDGMYVGAKGYSRAYYPRTLPGPDGQTIQNPSPDSHMSYQLPQNSAGRSRIAASDNLCGLGQNTPGKQTQGYPQLMAKPGAYVAAKYLENGHVSLPENQAGKPGSGGVVYIYVTSQPKDDEKLADVLKWNTGGTGGDKRGKLISQQNFDDGRCYQINSGPISQQRVAANTNHTEEQWCESNFQIPEDAEVGKDLAMYWVWDWATKPNVDPGLPMGKDEYYTTCSDIKVVNDMVKANAIKENALLPQDPQTEAVADYKERAANLTNTVAPHHGDSASSSAPVNLPASSSPTPAQFAPLPASSSTTSAVTSDAVTSSAKAIATDVPRTFVTMTATATQMVTQLETVTQTRWVNPTNIPFHGHPRRFTHNH